MKIINLGVLLSISVQDAILLDRGMQGVGLICLSPALPDDATIRFDSSGTRYPVRPFQKLLLPFNNKIQFEAGLTVAGALNITNPANLQWAILEDCNEDIDIRQSASLQAQITYTLAASAFDKITNLNMRKLTIETVFTTGVNGSMVLRPFIKDTAAPEIAPAIYLANDNSSDYSEIVEMKNKFGFFISHFTLIEADTFAAEMHFNFRV